MQWIRPSQRLVVVSVLMVAGADRIHAVPPAGPLTIASATDADASARAAAGFGMPAGFEVSLFAAEPDVRNPVAFSIDERGVVWVCETFRQNRGVTDNRAHDRTWVEADIAAQSVADRIAFHRRLLGSEAASYELEADRVRRLVDADGDGRADRADVFAGGFSRLEDGTAAGILARRGDVWLACIPSLYRLRDLDDDGTIDSSAEERKVLSTGYGVRVAYRGHDLHGLCFGPDGRVYFTIGDRGFHVEHDGRLDHEPGRGAVFRCEPDGTRLEVVSTGLRNPQEIAFDDLGNLFTVDNNSDAGDRARLVHLVPGADAGWRMEYQYLDDRGPWHREKIWHTETDGQPAFCLPPVAHVSSGPSGLVAYPGTGLTPHFAGRFLLVDFRGGAATSCVRSFRVVPRGGSFALADEEETITNVLATDVDIGPDGALWVSDWVHGWDGDGKGRLWRFQPRDRGAESAALVAEVRELLAGDWADAEAGRLVSLLGHADRRIRLESQWELVRRADRDRLAGVLGDLAALPLARVHAAQGLAQVLRSGDAAAAAALVTAAGDATGGVRLVAARSLGDCPPDLACRGTVRRTLAELLSDADLHVVATAATSLGRLGHRSGDQADVMAAIRRLAESPAAQDRVVRHAAAMAIAGAAAPADLDALVAHAAAEVRLITCVALRRLHDERLAALLDDDSEAVATEAARAIHDLAIAPLLPALAARAATGPTADAFLRRAVSAAEQVGTAESATALVHVIGRDAASSEARREAIDALATWADPPRVNRVTGVWLPGAVSRDAAVARAALEPALADVVAAGGRGKADEAIRGAVLTAASRLGLRMVSTILRARAVDSALPAAVRAQAIDALLESVDADLDRLAGSLLADSEPEVRMAARRARAARNPTSTIVPDLVAACGGPSIAERQQAVGLLAGISEPAATAAIETLVADLRGGTLDPAIELEVREAAAVRLGTSATAPLTAADSSDPLADWRDVLVGGDVDRGHRIFRSKAEVSCVRCHQAAGQGGEVGPKLDGIAVRRDARYLLEAVVHPNAKVADGYATTVIVTDDGRTVSGIVVAEDDAAVTLRDAEGRERVISTKSIDERASGPSAMPADLAGKLSRRELRDLLAWLHSLR